MDPVDYKYSRQSTWICVEDNGKAKIGITNFAQDQLGDIMYIQMPVISSKIDQFQKLGEIEAQKTITDFYSPAGGIVVEVNQKACDDPSIVNRDPYGEGWLVKIDLSDTKELEALMDANQYAKFLE